jgi:hemerythrin
MGLFDWIFKKKRDDLSLKWQKSYSVGIIDIDAQHKKLFSFYDDLVDAIYKGETNENLGKCLDGLLNYVVVHFDTEEAYMSKLGYPEYEKHKAEHKALREKTYYLHKDYSEGKPVLTLELLDFFRKWISQHVLTTDKKYQPFLMSKLPKEYHSQ